MLSNELITTGFTANDALIAFLTVESLSFAALAVAVSFATQTNRVPSVPARKLAYGAAGFVTVLAFGGLMAWWSIFATHWPSGFRGAAIGVTLALAVVGQPGFAWVIAYGLKPKT
jgi:hypothetical protein